MAYDKRKFVADPRACILPKGAAFGDRRFRYKNWWCLTADEKRRAAQYYPHNTPGIPDSAYAYPIDASGNFPKGRVSRTLIWSRQHVISRRAGQGLSGRARKRRRR